MGYLGAMQDSRARAVRHLLLDGGMLLLVLGVAFRGRITESPEWLMVGAALFIHLLVGSQESRWGWRALITVVAGSAVFGVVWGRVADGGWLLAWYGLTRLVRVLPAAGAWVLRWGRAVVPRVLALAGAVVQSAAVRRGAVGVAVGAVIAGAGWLAMHYVWRGQFGAGDAYWYATVVADFVVQVREGVLPPWLGQSEYAFYGGSFPLRFAPYLQHLGAVIDLLTLRSLPPYAIVNVAVAVSLFASVVGVLLCLRRLVPERTGAMAGVAWLYASCPAVVGLAFAQDLYMSVSALPFLPLALTGAIGLLEEESWSDRLLIVVGLAGAWLAHPPLGLWMGLIVLALQIPRLRRPGAWRASWRRDLATVGGLLWLSSYSVISVLTLGPRPPVFAPYANHVQFITSTFPGNWLPLAEPPRGLASLQVGYGIAALGGGLVFWLRHRLPLAAKWLWGIGAGLLLLVTPVPGLIRLLWRAVPQPILNLTDIWPMQRLMPLGALCLLFAFALAWPVIAAGRRWRLVWGLLLAGGLGWSTLEVLKFARYAAAAAPGWERTAQIFRPENRVMTREADPELEHRFLDPRTLEMAGDAGAEVAASGGGPVLAGPVVGRPVAGGSVLELSPRLSLEPGRRYLLRFEFAWPADDYAGTLLMSGREFHRLYQMPESGGARAFGAGPASARWLGLQNSGRNREEILLRWSAADPQSPHLREAEVVFGRFALYEIRPSQLAVQVVSWVPYRATVRVKEEAYLETPRLFLPGYLARVDGREVPAEQSPDGLVMVRLAPGRHTVELTYRPAWLARAAYFFTATGWVGVLGWAGWAGWRRFQRRGAGLGLRA
jgi:hypothetical protein